jgi:hypothetical protein
MELAYAGPVQATTTLTQGAHALDYLTDGHDEARPGTYSNSELSYIARSAPGWKTELEGGSVGLHGFGALQGVSEEAELREQFESACLPWHDSRGKTGYKSFTLTLPKELSLLAEGDRKAGDKAMLEAVDASLKEAFGGFKVSAVAAIHRRNEVGEIHHHVHVLVAKFATREADGRTVSLNSTAGGNDGYRVANLKSGWKHGIDRGFAKHFGVEVQQTRQYARPRLKLSDGTVIEPLNRDTRRKLDQSLGPMVERVSATGKVTQQRFRLNDKMDGVIFEVAAGKRPDAKDGAQLGWDKSAFAALFPDRAKDASRFEKRVETLKNIGYLDAEGRITQAFRLHYSARAGIDTPELQRLRLDLGNQARAESRATGRPTPVPEFWEAAQQKAWVRSRIDRLGFSKDDLEAIRKKADSFKPTREQLDKLRKEQQELAELASKRGTLKVPQAKQIGYAWIEEKRAQVHLAGAVFMGIAKGDPALIRAAIARRNRAKWDLFYAKQMRTARIAAIVRPGFTRHISFGQRDRLYRSWLSATRLSGREAYETERKTVYAAWYAEHLHSPIEKQRKASESRTVDEQKGSVEQEWQAQKLFAAANVSTATADFVRGWNAATDVLDASVLEREAATRLRQSQQAVAAHAVNPDALIDRLSKAISRETSMGEAVLSREETRGALAIGRAGLLLRGEAAALNRPASLPDGAFTAKEFDDARRLAARLSAIGGTGADPISAEHVLTAQTRGGEYLKRADALGLTDDGQAWAFNGRASETRHLALDIRAAAIAGEMSRHHIVWPKDAAAHQEDAITLAARLRAMGMRGTALEPDRLSQLRGQDLAAVIDKAREAGLLDPTTGQKVSREPDKTAQGAPDGREDTQSWHSQRKAAKDIALELAEGLTRSRAALFETRPPAPWLASELAKLVTQDGQRFADVGLDKEVLRLQSRLQAFGIRCAAVDGGTLCRTDGSILERLVGDAKSAGVLTATSDSGWSTRRKEAQALADKFATWRKDAFVEVADWLEKRSSKTVAQAPALARDVNVLDARLTALGEPSALLADKRIGTLSTKTLESTLEAAREAGLLGSEWTASEKRARSVRMHLQHRHTEDLEARALARPQPDWFTSRIDAKLREEAPAFYRLQARLLAFGVKGPAVDARVMLKADPHELRAFVRKAEKAQLLDARDWAKRRPAALKFAKEFETTPAAQRVPPKQPRADKDMRSPGASMPPNRNEEPSR